MGNFEERFISDKIKMGAYPTLLLLVLLTWTAQHSICKPHHGEPHKEATTSIPENSPFCILLGWLAPFCLAGQAGKLEKLSQASEVQFEKGKVKKNDSRSRLRYSLLICP